MRPSNSRPPIIGLSKPKSHAVAPPTLHSPLNLKRIPSASQRNKQQPGGLKRANLQAAQELDHRYSPESSKNKFDSTLADDLRKQIESLKRRNESLDIENHKIEEENKENSEKLMKLNERLENLKKDYAEKQEYFFFVGVN